MVEGSVNNLWVYWNGIEKNIVRYKRYIDD